MPKSSKKYGLNQAEIARLSGGELRRTYQKLRKQALNRAEKLRMAGYEDYTIAHPRFPSLPTIDRNADPERSYKSALREVSRYLNREQTNVGYLKRQELEVTGALKQSGYDIPKDKLKDFGLFMEHIRDYYGKYSYPSESAATIFEQGYKKGMSKQTIVREFNKYLKDKRDIAKLAKTLTNIDTGKTRTGTQKRLTSTALKEAFRDDWGDPESE